MLSFLLLLPHQGNSNDKEYCLNFLVKKDITLQEEWLAMTELIKSNRKVDFFPDSHVSPHPLW